MPKDRWEDASAYDQYMGRWSRALGREFVAMLGVPSDKCLGITCDEIDETLQYSVSNHWPSGEWPWRCQGHGHLAIRQKGISSLCAALALPSGCGGWLVVGCDAAA